jgi:hypothetical protein
MVKVKDASEAERMILYSFPGITEPKPINFRIQKTGNTWVVKFDIINAIFGVEEHERHINANTGAITIIK